MCVGFLFTYISPLAFVLSVTIAKEAYDDYKRYRRDKEANSQRYEVLTADGMSFFVSLLCLMTVSWLFFFVCACLCVYVRRNKNNAQC